MALYLYKLLVVRPQMLIESTPEESRIVSEHFQYLQKLMADGVLVLAGRTTNNDLSTFGIALINADSEEAAWKIVQGDPVIQNRVMRGEVYPYRLALFEPQNVLATD
jgi:uncharacterized protein